MQSLYPTTKHDPKCPNYKGPSSMDCREWEYHAQGVYPTLDTSRMRISRVKQEEEDTRVINSKRVLRNLEERNVSTTKKSPKQGLTSAEDLTVMFLEGRDSPTIDVGHVFVRMT